MGLVQRLAAGCRHAVVFTCGHCAWYLARNSFGAEIGEWLKLDDDFARAGGFLAIFVVVLIGVAIAARILRKVFHFAGFGIPDRILGLLVSAAKTLLILSLLFSAFDAINKDQAFIKEEKLEASICYRPMINISEALFPFIEWARDQISTGDEQTLIWSDSSQEL